MKVVLKNTVLIFKSPDMEPVTIGPSLETISALSLANSGDIVDGYKGANAACKGVNINKVTKINFKVSDGGDGVNRGATVFFRMTVVDGVCTGIQEVARYTYNSEDLGSIKSIDVNITLGENDYISMGGNFFYSVGGGQGTVRASHIGDTVTTSPSNNYGYNLEGFKIVTD